METKGQINHTATARRERERLPQMLQRGVETVESIRPWNKYNRSYSIQQRVAQSPLKTNFYEDEYKKMVSRMDQKEASAKTGKTVDPFGELLQLSVLADQGYRSWDLGYTDNLPTAASPPWKRKSRVSIHSLLKWKRYQDEKHELFMSMMGKLEMNDLERFRHLQRVRKQRRTRVQQGDFADSEDFRASSTPEQREGDFRMSNASEGGSSMSSMPDGDFMIRSSAPEEDFRMGAVSPEEDLRKGTDFVMGTTTEDDFMFNGTDPLPCSQDDKRMISPSKNNVQKSTAKNGKVSLCRHFTKGWCRQGDACSFQHSVEGSYPDSQKVFMGGLPHSITPAKLLWELKQQGYVVVNEPKIFRGFSPQVCLSTTAQAMKMLREEKMMICGCAVDIRPYKASTKKERDRQLDTNNRSVFLGGLPSSVTVQIVKTELEKLGMKVTNRPLIKAGFIPKVTLATAEQAQQLVAKGTIDINGAVVSVRPYVSKIKSATKECSTTIK